ncbi:hypothetical protein H2201_008847, partial [Coniosporium apollinis]
PTKTNPIGVADEEMTVKGKDATFLKELCQRFPPLKPEEQPWVKDWADSYATLQKEHPGIPCTLCQHALIMRQASQRWLITSQRPVTTKMREMIAKIDARGEAARAKGNKGKGKGRATE